MLFSTVTSTPSVKLSWTVLSNVSVQDSVHCPSILCVVVTDRHILMNVLFKYNPAELRLASLWLSEGCVVCMLLKFVKLSFLHSETDLFLSGNVHALILKVIPLKKKEYLK